MPCNEDCNCDKIDSCEDTDSECSDSSEDDHCRPRKCKKGPQGKQGPQGAQANVGNTGPQGPQGWMGYQGPQGNEGQRGFQGSQGFVGYQGPQGNEGQRGFQGSQGFRGFQGPQGFRGFQGPQGSMGPQGIPTGATVASAYFYGETSYDLAVPTSTVTGNVVFNTQAYNQVGSGVTQVGTFQFDLLVGTYLIDWQVRGIPGTAVPITFSILDVTNSVVLAGTTFSADLSAVVEQVVTSSVGIGIGVPITISIRNDSGTTISETAGGSPARSNRSIRFVKLS